MIPKIINKLLGPNQHYVTTIHKLSFEYDFVKCTRSMCKLPKMLPKILFIDKTYFSYFLFFWNLEVGRYISFGHNIHWLFYYAYN